MKVKSNNLKFVVIVISIIMLMFGCAEKEKERETGEEKERVTLSQGSYRNLESNSIYSLNEDNIYEKIDTEELVISYNSESGNYIFIQDDDVFINYLGKNIRINDINL